jgi:cobalt-zinc-cadmium efflux system membrane fusion protein
MSSSVFAAIKRRLPAILVALLIAAVIGFFVLRPWLRQGEPTTTAPTETTAVELVRDRAGKPIAPPTLRLTQRTAKALGVTPDGIVAAKTPVGLRALPPQMGTLAYDSDRLYSVFSRFAGQVSEIMDCPADQRGSIPLKPNPGAKTGQQPPPKERSRQFTVGDRVKKDQLLAIVWSRDLGDKKAALIDAIIDLRRDNDRLNDLEKLYYEGSVSAATYYEAQRTVKKDISARNAAERTLRIWKLTDAEIDEVIKEAKTIKEELRDPKVETNWARVEVRAPSDGVIVEKNTHIDGWVDPSNFATPMFRIADLTKLQVWLSPSEEYLPVLQEFLKKPSSTPLEWEIYLQAEPKAPPLTGTLLRMGTSVDYAQHTPLLVALIDNPKANLLVGQFVLATLSIALEDNLVEIPTTAVNEEKGQSVVFVQRDGDGKELDFTMRAVSVAYRFKDTVYVRSAPPAAADDAAADGFRVEGLKAGDRVVTQSVVELTQALRDLVAKEKLSASQH